MCCSLFDFIEDQVEILSPGRFNPYYEKFAGLGLSELLEAVKADPKLSVKNATHYLKALQQLSTFSKKVQRETNMSFFMLIKNRRPDKYEKYLEIMDAKTRPLEVIVDDYLKQNINEEDFQKELVPLSEKYSQNIWIKENIGANIGRKRIDVNWTGMSMIHKLPSQSQVDSQFMVAIRRNFDEGYEEIGVKLVGHSGNYLVNINDSGETVFAKAYTKYPTQEEVKHDHAYRSYIKNVYFHYGIPMSMYGNSKKLSYAQTFEIVKIENQQNILTRYQPTATKKQLIELSCQKKF
ncbi:hypothetical protein [Aquamicrobium sp.]|uniref:hypothetical protein n=1 Tax=Aquamicrobium sp. TaxID=1872579 RepID=UPI002587B702|nr:hypothetical protein [Aquamicrobium sp.]MCK9551153.1 hypothetical protein [Aquamicrobium sp.]